MLIDEIRARAFINLSTIEDISTKAKTKPDAMFYLQNLKKETEKGNMVILHESNLEELDFNDIEERLEKAQNFSLSKEFTEAGIEKLVDFKAVAKLSQLFKLPYDYTWLEWSDYSEKQTSSKFGVLLYSNKENENSVIVNVFVLNKDEFNGYDGVSYKGSFIPSSIALEGKNSITISVDLEGIKDKGISLWFAKLCIEVFDFIIRINSPRITEIVLCENLEKLNNSRKKKGKKILMEYRIVDLNKTVKKALKDITNSEIASSSHRRLHWRRGHFKAFKSGLYWWNPHLVGNEEEGIIHHDYKF